MPRYPNLFSLAFVNRKSNVAYCDLGNETYALALDLVWPGCFDSWHITNVGTKGDIVQALFGWCFLARKGDLSLASESQFVLAQSFARHLEFVAVYVYRHHDYHAHYDNSKAS